MALSCWARRGSRRRGTGRRSTARSTGLGHRCILRWGPPHISTARLGELGVGLLPVTGVTTVLCRWEPSRSGPGQPCTCRCPGSLSSSPDDDWRALPAKHHDTDRCPRRAGRPTHCGNTSSLCCPDPTDPTLAAIRGTTTRTRAPGANHDGNRTEHRPTRR